MTREEWDKLSDDEKYRKYCNFNPHGFTVGLFDLTGPYGTPCTYCLTDWDCAVRTSCPHSDERNAYFEARGSYPRGKVKA